MSRSRSQVIDERRALAVAFAGYTALATGLLILISIILAPSLTGALFAPA
jgi:hypothetical protein|tara:strand:+ start:30480 stop:30629 length:150 start_codon:yes stop_codon:yes gene_type:complete